MKKLFLSAILLAVSIPLYAQSNGRTELNLPDPRMLGRHFSRDAKPGGGPPKSPNLTYHNGPIMTSVVVKAIFWGPDWTSPGDKISGLNTFYAGVGGTAYANTNTEYNGLNGTVVSNSVTHLGSIVDISATSSRAPSTSTVLNEVCKALAQDGTTPVSNGYYPVYTDISRRGANYCAWHSWGTCSGVPIQFGFFFNLDGDSGCDPQDSNDAHSQGLEALANVSGHELSEAMTDPRGTGWYDSTGYENSDKCAWSYGTPLLTFNNGSQWKIQGNWSNRAYDKSPQAGYANSQGQLGCIDGGNYPLPLP